MDMGARASRLHYPAFIRPIAGNGFIVGTLLALLLEHVLFRKTAP